MVGIPDDLPKFKQIKIRRILNDKLISYLKDFDPEEFFDGPEERAFAMAHFEEELLEELIETIANL